MSSRWTTPSEIKERLRRRWERGEILAQTSLFPLRLPIKGPGSAEISADFAAVQDWIASWRRQEGIPCEWREFSHRLFGANQMPAAALFPDAGAVVSLLGVRRRWEAFCRVTERTQASFPELLPWLTRRPMLVLELAPDWERLLAVAGWIRDHPRSGIYLR